MPARDLDTLRGECQRVIEEREREMDRLGVDKIDLDHRGRRYFLHAYGKSAAVERFLSSDLMTQIAKAALGDTVYLFNEQYVVRPRNEGCGSAGIRTRGSSSTRTCRISPAGSRSTT